MRTHNLIVFLIAVYVVPKFADAVTIEMVTVGNPGNAPDTPKEGLGFGSLIGSVRYTYQIGKYEVTAGQYTEFLNAVAKDDPDYLYDIAMSDPTDWYRSFGANIQRYGSSPNYSYSVDADWENRPVNHVSIWDAARFANWLHNGQPTGAQGPGTTEDGAYHDIGNPALFGRNADAKFFIPTESEWYKAAYHKNDGVSGNYWEYPTASDTAPVNTLPDPVNHANFLDDEEIGTGSKTYSIGAPYFRTRVGEFANSPSPYGTFDQGGNVAEWNETCSYLTCGLLGGSFANFSLDLRASHYGEGALEYEYPFAGFRVASYIPEPGTLLLGMVAGVVCLLPRGRRA